MLVKRIKYVDFLGNTRDEEFYFNYSKADVNRLMFSTKEGLGEFLKRITREEDRTKMFGFLEEFILGAYGEVSHDGRQFIKNEELSTSFKQSNAYSELLEEFIEGGDIAVSNFINAVVPKETAEAMAKAREEAEAEEKKEVASISQMPAATPKA